MLAIRWAMVLAAVLTAGCSQSPEPVTRGRGDERSAPRQKTPLSEYLVGERAERRDGLTVFPVRTEALRSEDRMITFVEGPQSGRVQLFEKDATTADSQSPPATARVAFKPAIATSARNAQQDVAALTRNPTRLAAQTSSRNESDAAPAATDTVSASAAATRTVPAVDAPAAAERAVSQGSSEPQQVDYFGRGGRRSRARFWQGPACIDANQPPAPSATACN